VQWADLARGFERGIETIGFFERIRIDADDRVDRWTFFVIGLDAIEIHLHQLPAGESAGSVGGMNVVNGGFE
jgi:hypothetical protein